MPETLTDPLPIAQALIRCASVTPENAGAMDQVEQMARALGFTPHRLPYGADADRPQIENLYARRGTGGPHLCFAGHTDVVPVGTGWTLEPFTAEVINNRLYGRGAADMKGAIAAFLAATARYLADNPDPPGSLSLLITGDEEGPATDGTCRVVDWLIERNERPDGCVVGEPTNPTRLGEMMKIGRRGSLNAVVTVFGTQGHVAYPHLADNPIPHTLRLMGALTAAPLDTGTDHFQPSNLEITSVDVGNTATNVIPAQARFALNIRFNDAHSGTTLSDWLRSTLDAAANGAEYRLDITISGESFVTPPGVLSDIVAGAVRAETGLDPDLSTTGGTSDARFIKDLCPVLEFGAIGQSMHKADEHILLDDLEGLTRIYQRVIADFMARGGK